MRQIKLVLEYDGTAYRGWQSQRKGPFTIQEILEKKLARFEKDAHRVVVYGASRTDAGVHALGQVATFRTKRPHAPEVFKKALNSMLPEDMRVLSARDVPEDFHPRKSAVKKTYFYLIALDPPAPVFFRRYAWEMPWPLNLEAMREAAGYLTGKMDFSAFRAAGCTARDAVREIGEIRMEELGEGWFFGAALNGRFVKISLTASGFLRHMARNIVGTLVEVGKGRMTPAQVKSILESGDRRLSGPTAPARGLFLDKVFY